MINNEAINVIQAESRALLGTIDRDPLVGAVIRGDASREEYIRFLEGTYHYVRWSGALLAATAAGLERTGRLPWLIALVRAKAAEESPHDRWALDDLRRCGVEVDRVTHAQAPVAVQAYVGWSLALADSGSPGFLGAAHALEFMSMHRARMAADNLRARSAIRGIEHAVSFLEGHGGADEAHVALLEQALHRIDDPNDQSAVRLSASVLGRLYPRFFCRAGSPSPWGA